MKKKQFAEKKRNNEDENDYITYGTYFGGL